MLSPVQPELVVTEPPLHLDEELLIERLKDHDESAFEDVVRTCTPRMLSVARRLLKSQDDAEDAVQQAFLSAFSSLDRFAGKCRLTTWLHRIVVNVCLMQIRHRQRHPAVPMQDLRPRFNDDGSHWQPVCDWSQAALDRSSRNETALLVQQALEKLPQSYHHVIQLRDIEGFNTATTAELLDVSEAVVKTRLHRARSALREILSLHFE